MNFFMSAGVVDGKFSFWDIKIQRLNLR
jgi:hypothetical protein